MPLSNGQIHSLHPESALDQGARIISQPLPPAGVRSGIFGGTPGLHEPTEQNAPHFVQEPLQPRGVMDGFVKTCQRWGLSRKEQLILLGYGGDGEFLGRQLLNGRWLVPSQDVKDRAGYILGISI